MKIDFISIKENYRQQNRKKMFSFTLPLNLNSYSIHPQSIHTHTLHDNDNHSRVMAICQLFYLYSYFTFGKLESASKFLLFYGAKLLWYLFLIGFSKVHFKNNLELIVPTDVNQQNRERRPYKGFKLRL